MAGRVEEEGDGGHATGEGGRGGGAEEGHNIDHSTPLESAPLASDLCP